MKQPAVAARACRTSTGDAAQRAPGSDNVAAFAPPAYGIEFVDSGMQATGPIQRVGKIEEEEKTLQGKFAAGPAAAGHTEPAANRAGMPASLKAGIESLSGLDLSDVRVNFNSARPARIDALAYAQGNDIHLAPGQEKHLPHEAWHVVQQRQGRVQATGQAMGAAINDDRDLEREAEEMGAKALRAAPRNPAQAKARSAKGGTVKHRSPGSPIQRKVQVNNVDQTDADTTWNRISGDGQITALTQPQQRKAKSYLKTWIAAYSSSKNPFSVSENRDYASDDHLIRALVGEVLSEENLDREWTLTQMTITSDVIKARVGSFMTRLAQWHLASANAIRVAANTSKGRYNYYYSSFFSLAWSGGNTLGQAIASPPSDTAGRIALAADYALQLRSVIRDNTDNTWGMIMPGPLDQARKTHWNPDEGVAWTQQARQHNVPLSAGPSATTAQLLALAVKINATANEKEALAWGIFAFFNMDLARNRSGTHRFHEVMAVAANYGVPYTPWVYPEFEPGR